ncbi:DUF2927 domain-containing protein [Actinoplanes rectilineatus]|uniref:DUF2927 domain-containing protein n=1 Tax=Actinoplanes rectilineatus TaxID=113571 RepID=UPI0006989AD0|nr:DUF2927 domain-containing protein [Actinoplanes rectilineatus]
MGRKLVVVFAALLITVAGCTPTATRSAPAASPSAPLPFTSFSASPSPSPSPSQPGVDQQTLRYFFEVALGGEYGDKFSVATMWTQPVVTVRVNGKPTAAARDCLDTVIADFNALTATTDLKLVDEPADLEMHFVPLSKFASIEKNYVKGNDGFIYVYWSDSHAITEGTVLIRSTGIPERIRCHLIREELTQGMGLLRDSDRYPGSVFYGGYEPAPTGYSAMDKRLIRLLYSGAIRPGDDRDTVTAAVRVQR